MYEQLIEKLIKKDVSAIAGKVVDDTEDIVIPVSVVPPPPPNCEQYLTEEECPAGCYWWGNACHSEPEPTPPPDPRIKWVVAIVAGVAIVGAVVFAMIRK